MSEDFEDFDELLEDADRNESDPFSAHNLAVSTFITAARIYDVLLALLTAQDKAVARDLLELHATGALMGPQPSFNGTFITDEVNLSGDLNEGTDAD